MRPPFYLRQLRRDLELWIQQGLVPASSRDAILGSLGGGSSAGRLETIIAIFGAILIGAGALSFVGANWAAMTKAARLFVLFGGMWLSYGVAVWFYANARALVAEAFVLLGVLLFGANIWLVAQTYNINSHYPDGTLLWSVGALAAAILVPSRAALGAALALGAFWTWQENKDFGQLIHLPFLVFWSVCAAQAAILSWRPGIHLAALSLIFWLVLSYQGFQGMLGWSHAEVMTIYILGPLAIWSAAQIRESGPNGLTLTAGHYAFFVFLAAFALLHLTEGATTGIKPSWLIFSVAASGLAIGAVAVSLRRQGATMADMAGTVFAILATLSYVLIVRGRDSHLEIPYLVSTLIVILWSLSRGARMDDRFVVNWSIVAFGGWVLYAYTDLFAGLMDQAVFFTIGGFLLIALALGLVPLRRILTAPRTTGAAS